MLRTHFTEPEFFFPSSNLENREGQIIDFFFFSFFPKRFYQGFVLYISWKLHFQHMAWIVCNFYVPLAFRSASQRTRPSLSLKHQKHVQELEIYTESHTFSSPNAAVFSTSDKIALTSLSRFLFLSFFIFQLCYYLLCNKDRKFNDLQNDLCFERFFFLHHLFNRINPTRLRIRMMYIKFLGVSDVFRKNIL